MTFGIALKSKSQVVVAKTFIFTPTWQFDYFWNGLKPSTRSNWFTLHLFCQTDSSSISVMSFPWNAALMAFFLKGFHELPGCEACSSGITVSLNGLSCSVLQNGLTDSPLGNVQKSGQRLEPFSWSHQIADTNWNKSSPVWDLKDTLQETNISSKNGILKMIFLFPRWDMLIPWRVESEAIFVARHRGKWSRLCSLPTTKCGHVAWWHRGIHWLKENCNIPKDDQWPRCDHRVSIPFYIQEVGGHPHPHSI